MLPNSQTYIHQPQSSPAVDVHQSNALSELRAQLKELTSEVETIKKQQRYLEYDLHARVTEQEEINDYNSMHNLSLYKDSDD